MKKLLPLLGLYALVAAGAAVASMPFVWMIGTAFKTYPESISASFRVFPRDWQLRNFYDAMIAAPFPTYFFNSFLVAGIVTIGVVVTALCMGYAFARLHFPGRGALFFIVLATMMIPFEVTLIPNFILINRLGWYDSYLALTVPWLASAFAVFLVRQSLLALPRDYDDAARMDGCGHLRMLVFVAAPLVKPALMTAALFAFLGSYNALVWPLIVTGSEGMRLVQVGLTVFTGDQGTRVNLLMAASTVIMAPTVLLYFLAQRYFLDSALGSGLKA